MPRFILNNLGGALETRDLSWKGAPEALTMNLLPKHFFFKNMNYS